MADLYSNLVDNNSLRAKPQLNMDLGPKAAAWENQGASPAPAAPAAQAQPQGQPQPQAQGQTPPATATGGGKATGNTIPDRGRGIGEVQGTGDGQVAGINATSPTVSIWRSQVRSGTGNAQDPGGVLQPLHGALGASVAGDDAIARSFGWTPNQSGGRSRQQALSDAGIAMRGQDAKDRVAFNQAAGRAIANTFGSSMEGGLADQRAQQFQKFTENPFLSVNPNTFGAKEWAWLGADADAKNKNDFRAVKLSDQDRSARVNYLQKWMADPYNVQRYGHLIHGMVETNGDKPMTDAQLRWSANFATRMDRQRKADTDLAQAQAVGFDKRAVGQYREALSKDGVDTTGMSDSAVKDAHSMREAQKAMTYFTALQKQRLDQHLSFEDYEALKTGAGNGLYGRAFGGNGNPFGGNGNPGRVMANFLGTMSPKDRAAYDAANLAGKNRTPDQEKLVQDVQNRAASAMLGQLRTLATKGGAGSFDKYMTLMGMYDIGAGGSGGRTNDGKTSTGQTAAGKADVDAINRLLGYKAPAAPAAPTPDRSAEPEVGVQTPEQQAGTDNEALPPIFSFVNGRTADALKNNGPMLVAPRPSGLGEDRRDSGAGAPPWARQPFRGPNEPAEVKPNEAAWAYESARRAGLERREEQNKELTHHGLYPRPRSRAASARLSEEQLTPARRLVHESPPVTDNGPVQYPTPGPEAPSWSTGEANVFGPRSGTDLSRRLSSLIFGK